MTTYPWESPLPVLQPQAAARLVNLTEDENGIPAFLKRVRMPDGSVQIGVTSEKELPPLPWTK